LKGQEAPLRCGPIPLRFLRAAERQLKDFNLGGVLEPPCVQNLPADGDAAALMGIRVRADLRKGDRPFSGDRSGWRRDVRSWQQAGGVVCVHGRRSQQYE